MQIAKYFYMHIDMEINILINIQIKQWFQITGRSGTSLFFQIQYCTVF